MRYKNKAINIAVLSALIMISDKGWALSLPNKLCGIGCVPLSVTGRSSLVGAGKVFIITNSSDEILHECTISVNSAEPIVFARTLPAHQEKEVGWLELGYSLKPGDEATFGCKGYLIDKDVLIPP